MTNRSLILPFVQQLSRIEDEEKSKFAFLKFETSHGSFENECVYVCAFTDGEGTCEKKKWANVVVRYERCCSREMMLWWTCYVNQRSKMIDKKLFCVSLYRYVCIHRAQLFTVNYLLFTRIVYMNRLISRRIKSRDRQEEKDIDIDRTLVGTYRQYLHLFHGVNKG